MTASIEAETVRPVFLISMDFASGFVYVNSSPYSLTFDANEYLGLGDYGGISAVEEGGELQAYGVTFTLTGIPSDYISIAFDEEYQGRTVTLYYGNLTEAHALTADPVIIWKGRMDVMDIEAGATSTVTVTAESVMAAWDKARSLRYNDASQQARYPGDLCMESVVQAEEKEVVWR